MKEIEISYKIIVENGLKVALTRAIPINVIDAKVLINFKNKRRKEENQIQQEKVENKKR